MNRTLRRALPLCAALLAAGAAARAEGPVGPGHGPDPKEEIERLSKKISQELRANEEALARLARGEKAEPKSVDIDVPPSTRKADAPSGGT